MRAGSSSAVVKTVVDQLRSTKRAASVRATRIARTAAPMSTLTYRLGERGRLGNQLFQIAGTIGIAASMDTDPVFLKSWNYRTYFSLPDRFFAGRLSIARSGLAWPYAVCIDEQARVYLGQLKAIEGEVGDIKARIEADATRAQELQKQAAKMRADFEQSWP